VANVFQSSGAVTDITAKDFIASDIILCPYNVKRSHWVLLAAYPKAKTFVVLDSLPGYKILTEKACNLILRCAWWLVG